MNGWTIQGPVSFTGVIEAPPDKSISHRAVILGALAEGETHIKNFLPSDDCRRTLSAFRMMGIQAEEHSETDITIHGGPLTEPDNPLDMGNSGTGVRLLAGVLAGQPFLSILTGDKSIRKRPMKRICDPLRKMGASILTRSGDLAPLAIRGGALQGIEYDSPVASAQVKSCLLLAGLFAEGPTTVTEPELSRDHSERMLRAFGAHLVREETSVTINPGNPLKARDVETPGDISSAAFFIVGATITPGSEIRIKNVGINPTRTGLIDALRQMGADISIEEQTETTGEPVATIIARSADLHGAEFDGEIIPRMIDEIPILALAAAFAEGETAIRNAEELRVKESDRLATVTAALEAVGAQVTQQPDGLIIHGGRTLRAGIIDSHGDHRIAMMGAIAGASVKGETRVNDVECVATSFPNFHELLGKMHS